MNAGGPDTVNPLMNPAAFSGVLNAIDGACSGERGIIFPAVKSAWVMSLCANWSIRGEIIGEMFSVYHFPEPLNCSYIGYVTSPAGVGR
ncbi:MAG: hypothetical protein PHT07_24890 [Paludibacter sp.]|nr:hypothetical protein [Paludibacter sp.]